MAVAIPVALAIGGGAAFAAAGLTVASGLALGWMVGSWLTQKKTDARNTTFDPGVQELPRINQALRGVAIPVLFGTNRCHMNMTIRANLDTQRHESRQSAGGGKGGGSGMGKSGGGGSTEVSYTYKQDLVFNFGLVPEEVSLLGGWLGGERISGDTLALIDQGAAGAEVQANLANTNAGLTFDDAYFSRGTDTSNWSYLPTLTNSLPVDWPNTAWLGFQQLLLGHQPIVPQMEFEIGPGGTAVTDPTSSSIQKVTGGPNPNKEDFLIARERDQNGSIYYGNMDTGAGGIAGAMTSSGDLIWELDDTQWMNAIEAATSQASGDHSSIAGLLVQPVQQGEKLVVSVRGNDGSINWMYLAVADPVLTGTPSITGVARVRRSSIQDMKRPVALLHGNIHSTNDEIWMVSLDGVGNDRSTIFRWPIIGQIESGIFESYPGAASFEWPLFKGLLPDDIGVHLMTLGNDTNGAFNYDDNGWFMLPSLAGGDYLYTYLPRVKVQFSGSNQNSYSTNSIAANYPNGMMIRSAVDRIGFGLANLPVSSPAYTVTLSPPEIVGSSFFLDINGGTDGRPPYLDDNLTLINSTPDNSAAWYRNVSVNPLASGAYLVGMAKTSNDPTDINSGQYMQGRVRFWTYNGIADKFTHQADIGGIVYRDDDWNGNFAGGVDNSTFMGFYDESTGRVFAGGTLGPSGLDDVSSPSPWINEFGALALGGIGEDRTPPFIIRELMRNPIFGIGVSSADIGTAGYQLADQYCEAQGFKVSCIFNRRAANVSEYIEMLLAVYGGFLTINNGLIDFGIVNFGDTTVRTLDDSHFYFDGRNEPVQISEGGVEDTINRVRVKYFDRTLQYRENVVEIGDEVDEDLNGLRTYEFPPFFVMSEGTASKIAERTLYSNLYAKRRIDGAVGWRDADIEPGDRVHLVSSTHPAIFDGLQARVVRKHEKERGLFALSMIEESEYIDDLQGFAHGETQASTTPLLGNPSFAQETVTFELPKEFQGEASPTLFSSYLIGGPTAGADLYASADNVSFAQALQSTPFPIAGRLAQGLPASNAFAENVEIYLLPTSGFNVDSPTFVATLQLDDVSAAGRAVGAGNIWVGSEMLAYEGVNLVGQNHYRMDRVYRGWGGTHIHAHNSGDVFFKQGGGIFSQPYNEDKVGTILYSKVTPFNFAGIAVDVASVSSDQHQIRGTFFAPQIIGAIHPWASSIDYRGVNKFSISSGDAISFTWSEASRCSGYGTGGYGTGGYGRFTSDTISWAYALSIVGSGGNVVRTTDVGTGFFEYAHADNVADNGLFYGQFGISITPFNDVSTATRISTRTLDVFEV